MTPAEIIELICPKLYSDSNRDKWIALAETRTSRCFFGANYNQAIALRASHGYSLSRRNAGEAGSISSRKMGPVSVSFNTGTITGALSMTTYGRELQGLVKSAGPGISVIGARGSLCDS
jgi:hypothetical protein